jgi:hypothetical protein
LPGKNQDLLSTTSEDVNHSKLSDQSDIISNESDFRHSVIVANIFSIFRKPILTSVRFLQSAMACAIMFDIRDTVSQAMAE